MQLERVDKCAPVFPVMKLPYSPGAEQVPEITVLETKHLEAFVPSPYTSSKAQVSHSCSHSHVLALVDTRRKMSSSSTQRPNMSTPFLRL